jgi:CubicO group peptidase (beta-lactamase class C family)
MKKRIHTGGNMKHVRILLFCILLAHTLHAAQAAPGRLEARPSSPAQVDPLNDPAKLQAFLDGMMSVYMTCHHIVGAAIAVVKDGEIILSRGYGYADLARKIKVDPEVTLFRTGSTAKLITWTAVMQLVQQGRIDLDGDINAYLRDFKIPATFAQPITMRNLLTHTAGFEDRALGLAARTPADLSTLAEQVREKMPARVYPPGKVAAYSNYGAALAGYIVERVSGLSYETYVEENIFKPLGMNHSTVRQPLPAVLVKDMALGYTFADGQYRPQEFELFKGMAPAGAMSSTVADMARFMIAHLQQGRYRTGRILNEATIRLMHSRMFAADARCNGMAGGFWEYRQNRLRLLEHGGDTRYFHTWLDLIPEKKTGIYLAYSGTNVDGPTMNRTGFIRAFIDRCFPQAHASVLKKLPGQKRWLASCAGFYWPSRSNLTGMEKLVSLFSQVRIKTAADGRLIYRNTAWTEIAPLVFQDSQGQDVIAFQRGASGDVTGFLNSRTPPLYFFRTPWHLNPDLHLLVWLFCLLMFLSTWRWPLRALWRKICTNNGVREPIPAKCRWPMVVLGAVHSAFIACLFLLLSDPAELFYGVPLLLNILLALPLLSIVPEAGTIALAVLSWTRKEKGVCQRIYYSLLALAGLLFLWSLYCWNLLRFRY